MAQNDKIQLFEDKRIRTAWDEEKEEWYFSVVDVVAVLTEQPDYQAARNYWKVTKKRLKDEGNETVTSCNQLKMTASDGKKRLTDVADTKQALIHRQQNLRVATTGKPLKPQGFEGFFSSSKQFWPYWSTGGNRAPQTPDRCLSRRVPCVPAGGTR
ncbi:MAG: hypothetical protein ACLVKM_10270 [Oscillospiraceae bacterium]